jgi:hypothetical protein
MNTLLICDRVIHDAETGQASLIGVLESVTSPDFPSVIPSMYVYAKMTDAQGEYVFKLELVRRDEMSVLGEAVMLPVSADDPMIYIEAVFQLHGVMLERTGYYGARLSANNTMFLDSTAFFAEETRE